MHYHAGRRPSPDQYGRVDGGRVSGYSAPPQMDPHRTAMYYLRVRTKALCYLTAFLGLMTFVSFWALYYWPIACAFMLLYLAFVCYREAAGYGALSSNWAFSRSGLFVGRELIFVVFGICFLLCLAEVVVGIVLCVVLDGATQVIFCAIGAVTGGLSLVAMYLLNRSLKYLAAPVLTMHPSIGPPPVVAYPTTAPPVYYYDESYPQQRGPSMGGEPYAMIAQPVVDAFERGGSPSRRPPSPRRVQFEPTDDRKTAYTVSSVPPTQQHTGRTSPTSVIPPAGLAEIGAVYHSPRTTAFTSPPMRMPYPYPTQQMGSGTSPRSSLYPERRF
jgi:hypothetical protein